MTHTVTADRVGTNVVLTLTVPAGDFVDLCAGLAWIDVLGGWAAWRTVLPIAGHPARLAGQFNLRRTYSDQAPKNAEAVAEPTQGIQAGTREDPAGAGAPGEQAGCRGCGEKRHATRAVELPAAAAASAPNGVPESTGKIWAEVKAAFERPFVIDPRDVPSVNDYYRPLGDPDE